MKRPCRLLPSSLILFCSTRNLQHADRITATLLIQLYCSTFEVPASCYIDAHTFDCRVAARSSYFFKRSFSSVICARIVCSIASCVSKTRGIKYHARYADVNPTGEDTITRLLISSNGRYILDLVGDILKQMIHYYEAV